MKPFTTIPIEKRSEVYRRVAGMMESIARDSGRVSLEASDAVAARCRFTLTRQGGIWGIHLPSDIRFAR